MLTVYRACLDVSGSYHSFPMSPSANSPATGIIGSGDHASLKIVSSYVKSNGQVYGFEDGITLEECSIP